MARAASSRGPGGGARAAIPRVGSTLRSSRREQRARAQAQAVAVPLGEGRERAYGVDRRAAEVDVARLVEVAHRHRHVADPEAEADGLHEELGVEDEIVRVALAW